MAYFLKVSKQQNRTYLSIYESFYSPDVKGTKQRSFRKIGNLDKLIEIGIEDPIAYFKNEVDELNEKRKQYQGSFLNLLHHSASYKNPSVQGIEQ